MPQSHIIADAEGQAQVRLGKRLAREKAKCFAEGRIWKDYVVKTYEFGRERADELIRIGLGLLSVEQARADKARRTRAYRLEARETRIKDIVSVQARRSRVTGDQIVRRLQRHGVSSQEREDIEQAVRDMVAIWEEVLRDVVRLS